VDRLPFAGLLLDGGEFEELAAGVAPAQRAGDRPGIAVAAIEVGVAPAGAGLEDALPAREVPVGMDHLAAAGEVEQRGRGRAAREGPIVADLRQSRAVFVPPFASSGTVFAIGLERMATRWLTVPLQPHGTEDVIADQSMNRSERGGAGADLVGPRRQAQIDALPGVALGLPVQRLMLPARHCPRTNGGQWLAPEQDRRQQVRAGPSPRRGMER
jgi:hypothetical protein